MCRDPLIFKPLRKIKGGGAAPDSLRQIIRPGIGGDPTHRNIKRTSDAVKHGVQCLPLIVVLHPTYSDTRLQVSYMMAVSTTTTMEKDLPYKKPGMNLTETEMLAPSRRTSGGTGLRCGRMLELRPTTGGGAS